MHSPSRRKRPEPKLGYAEISSDVPHVFLSSEYYFVTYYSFSSMDISLDHFGFLDFSM